MTHNSKLMTHNSKLMTMTIKNVEIKARCTEPDAIRDILTNKNADFKGTDHQIDTYFKVEDGRLKLREGTIENNLIYYQRPDTASPKLSDVHLVPIDQPEKMKALLTAALDVKVVVDKKREIYYIDNVKFHIDEVKEIGNFVEIEAIDEDGSINEAKLHEQCEYYMQLFKIKEENLVAESYSDLVIE